ncbi:MAG: helix-turn-helix transcriptional regulator [Pseudomonadota bacterium]|nr:helix-turn-helix transcriptional regulator [Pseudomonadota bacterium]
MNTRAFYEARAKSLIKDLREEKGISYKDLARRLEAEGTPIDVQVLINRVNQGKYSFSFALQLLAAMGVETVTVTKPMNAEGKKA